MDRSLKLSLLEGEHEDSGKDSSPSDSRFCDGCAEGWDISTLMGSSPKYPNIASNESFDFKSAARF